MHTFSVYSSVSVLVSHGVQEKLKRTFPLCHRMLPICFSGYVLTCIAVCFRLWLCTFTLSVSGGAVLLLPISIVANEALLMFPNSYYLQWMNTSLIHGQFAEYLETEILAAHTWKISMCRKERKCQMLEMTEFWPCVFLSVSWCLFARLHFSSTLNAVQSFVSFLKVQCSIKCHEWMGLHCNSLVIFHDNTSVYTCTHTYVHTYIHAMHACAHTVQAVWTWLQVFIILAFGILHSLCFPCFCFLFLLFFAVTSFIDLLVSPNLYVRKNEFLEFADHD